MFDFLWYKNLAKPPFSPPDWIFTPVWIVLYIFIFASLALYFARKSENKKSGYIYYFVQLLLNFIWFPIFFRMQNIKLAFVDIILLIVFVILTIYKFYSVSKFSGLILVPYLLWIIFAAYLNAGILFLN